MSETQVLIKEMATGLMAAEATPRPPGGSRSEALSEISPEAREFSRRGCRLRASGRLEEAAAFHREAIALSPRFAEAHNNLGNCLRELKLLNQAVESYYRAVSLRPGYAEAFGNLGVALYELGHVEHAMKCYRRAIELKPRFANAHFNLGNALLREGKHQRAVDAFSRAISLRPRYAAAFNSRGNARRESGQWYDAGRDFIRATELDPGFAEAHANVGLILAQRKDLQQAEKAFRTALSLKAGYLPALNNLGVVLKNLKRFEEAEAVLRGAIASNPTYAEAYSNLALVLRGQEKFDEALTHLRRAIDLKPFYAEAHNNMGVIFKEMQRWDDAVEAFSRALKIQAQYPEARFNLSTTLLLLGHLEKGWREYECRWDLEIDPENLVSKRPELDAPTWCGEALDGKTILVHHEQGLGDTIQFVRYLSELARRGAKVIFLHPAPMARLLAPLAGAVELTSNFDNRRPIDYCCPLMSLAGALGERLDGGAAFVPYLRAEAERVALWRRHLGGAGFKVGIVWQGNPRARIDSGRSIPLREFSPLAQVPGARLISLQKEHGLDQLTSLPIDMMIERLGPSFDSGTDAFIDTAAVMENLDLVVTSDTAIAHLAGALGKPVWVALSTSCDWRWFLDRRDSPWYPTMRLYRQQRRGDWSSVFSQMARDLQETKPGKMLGSPEKAFYGRSR